MTNWSNDLVTHSGFKFHVRPVRADDTTAVQEFFKHVTPEDLRFRFLTTVKAVDHERLAEIIEVDHRQKESFLAYEQEGSPILAVAVLACDEGLDIGEVAISTRSDLKNRGISWELLRHVARYAQAKGVRRLQSLEDRSNQSAIRLEREMGFTSMPYAGDPTLSLLEKTLA